MDTDEGVLLIRGRAPAPAEEVNHSDDNGPATIEVENLDPETTAEDVKVTYARRAAAMAAVENLNGKKADKDLILRVRLRKHPIFHDVPVIPSPHMPSPIAGPLKLLTQAVKGTIANAGTIYADQVLAAQQMLKVQQHRMAQLQMEEQRIAALRMQANAHFARPAPSSTDPSRNPFMAYSTITDRTSGKSVATILQNIVNGNVIVDYTDRRPTVDALMQDLKEGGVARNWHERERILALQALKTLGRATEGCDSIFTEEGIRTLLYHSGLHKATEASIDRTSSREALKCLANALLLKPTTRPIFERLDGHGQCSALLKRSHLSNESQFLFSRILFLVTIDATTIVKSLLDEHHAVDNVGVVLKTQLARTPDGTMFSQSMVLSEALKYLFNLMIVDPKIERATEANFSEKEKTEATGKRFQSPNPLEPPHSHAIHVLLNFPISTSALLVTRSQQATLLSVLLQILDDTLRHSLNTDEEASTDGLSNGTELDEIVPPLVIVLTNIASAGGEGRAALKARMLPEDVDRSKPLDKGNTFSARLIRRMTSMRFPQIRETVSQLLFVVCDEDPAILTRHVGYGNAAGFLMNRNLGVPSSVSGAGADEANSEATERPSSGPASHHSPPAASSSSSTTAAGADKPPSPTPPTPSMPSMPSSRRYSSASAVNPITGAYYPDPSAIRTAMADMTEEEKEEEASKLLDMFDKLRRTGVMDVRNPALEAGLRQRERDRYYDEQEMREQAEEEELERTYGKV
ncbi:hypothetical protein EC968_005093 [Mortierella alpina]|nr:hypothetical protein EC968_005093 [Mortierella alpina]